jgi:hypothetical protein
VSVIGESNSYEHGPQPCRRCFTENLAWNSPETQKFEAGRNGQWKLRANPGYWGSPNPEILVLGFSKGPSQNVLIDSGIPFEQVPFNDDHRQMRPNLRQLLQVVGLIDERTDFDRLFEPSERRFGFASLIRCSVTIWDGKDWKGAEGNILGRTIAARPRFVSECAMTHLKGRIPDSVRLIVMLGANKTYVPNVMKLLGGRSFEGNAGISYAYSALGRTVVHVPHPSPSAKGYIRVFCGERDPNNAERDMLACREQVFAAIGKTLGGTLEGAH